MEPSDIRVKLHASSLPENKHHIWSTYYCNFRCEIFDSEIWKWRELEDVLLPHGVLFTNKNAVVAGAVIYFLRNNNQVLGFHDETYTIFSLPEAVCNNGKYKNKQLLEYRGRLGLVCKAPEGYLELWIMEDYKNREWKRRQMLRINESVKDDLFPVAFFNADIALMKGFKRVGFYKFQDSNFNIVNLNIDPSEVFAFRSDPEPTNLNNRI
ncbi:hypothetical protein F0562_029766 [Nyssa sinensis]|uniref:F-box associated beta-propeller type 3 domain-containing protein n=1 Tax=Nyssa sinensis TaxID=561372 RepID=A0A5J5AYD0_9ASTE|nr:hypothetical protein F0562_029766 [Nyssa sinensis]